MDRCFYCGQEVSPEAKTCPKCGQPFYGGGWFIPLLAAGQELWGKGFLLFFLYYNFNGLPEEPPAYPSFWLLLVGMVFLVASAIIKGGKAYYRPKLQVTEQRKEPHLFTEEEKGFLFQTLMQIVIFPAVIVLGVFVPSYMIFLLGTAFGLPGFFISLLELAAGIAFMVLFFYGLSKTDRPGEDSQRPAALLKTTGLVAIFYLVELGVYVLGKGVVAGETDWSLFLLGLTDPVALVRSFWDL